MSKLPSIPKRLIGAGSSRRHSLVRASKRVRFLWGRNHSYRRSTTFCCSPTLGRKQTKSPRKDPELIEDLEKKGFEKIDEIEVELVSVTSTPHPARRAEGRPGLCGGRNKRHFSVTSRYSYVSNEDGLNVRERPS